MAEEWYVERDGKSYGPFAAFQLRQLVESGRLEPSARVRKGEDETWQAVKNVEEIAPELVQGSRTDPHPRRTRKPTPRNFLLLAGVIAGACLLLGVVVVVAVALSDRRKAATPEPVAVNTHPAKRAPKREEQPAQKEGKQEPKQPSPVSNTRDRQVAVRVLGLGGRVSVVLRPSQEAVEVKSANALPKEGFSLAGIFLSGNEHVSDDLVTEFVGLSRLTALDLRTWAEKGELSDRGLAHLKGLTSLRELRVGGRRANVTDAGLENVKGLENLEVLGLGGTRVTNEGLKHLRGMKKLKVLLLTHLKGVTDDGVAEVCSLPNLSTLWLDNTGVGDGAFPHLSRISTLKEVKLNGTKVTGEGVRRLKTSLPACQVAHLIPLYKVVSPLGVELTTDLQHVQQIAAKYPGNFTGGGGHHQGVLGYAHSSPQADADRLRCYFNGKAKRYVYGTAEMSGKQYTERPMNAWVPTRQVPGATPRYVFFRPGEDDCEYGVAGNRDFFRKCGFGRDRQMCFLFDSDQ